MAILRLEDICYGYEDGGYRREILKHLSYEFEEGEFYTILGPSGSGKTTLLSIIAGLDRPEQGKIYYENEDIENDGLLSNNLVFLGKTWVVCPQCGTEIVLKSTRQGVY